MIRAELYQEYYGWGVSIYVGNNLIHETHCIQWLSVAMSIVKFYLNPSK